MQLIDVRIGNEYVHEDLGRCVVVAIHPQDPACWVIRILDTENDHAYDITESKFLHQITRR